MSEKVFVVVQEGGSSTELYTNSFDTEAEANEYRADCAKHTYRTTPPIEVPRGFEKYLNEMQEVLHSLWGLELVDVPEEEEEVQDAQG